MMSTLRARKRAFSRRRAHSITELRASARRKFDARAGERACVRNERAAPLQCVPKMFGWSRPLQGWRKRNGARVCNSNQAMRGAALWRVQGGWEVFGPFINGLESSLPRDMGKKLLWLNKTLVQSTRNNVFWVQNTNKFFQKYFQIQSTRNIFFINKYQG